MVELYEAKRKPALRQLYLDVYSELAQQISDISYLGPVLELGSGNGFIKEVIPNAITSDVSKLEGVDLQIDARKLNQPDQSLGAILMFNVFHHISDAQAFLTEASRVLKPGGRIVMVEPVPGIISSPVLRYFHFEDYRPNDPNWSFEQSHPLWDSNQALPWIVFIRDRVKFEKQNPLLRVKNVKPICPLSYWLTGGQRKWSLLNEKTYQWSKKMDEALVKMFSKSASFSVFTIEKVNS